MRHPGIQAIGTAVPVNKISQQQHASIIEAANGISREERLVLKTVYGRSGIRHRYSVLSEFERDDSEDNLLFHPSGKFPEVPVSARMNIYEQYAAEVCGEAVNDCLSQLPSLDKKEITHLITFSCTGMHAPGLDIQLVENFGLARNVERTCINFMGCYAAINAFKSAYYIAKSEPEAVVLIAGVELCSLHYRKSNDPYQVVANAIFGDGAAAAIISMREINDGTQHVTLGLRNFYSEFEPNASNDMVWRIGDFGFDLRLTPEVPNVVKGNIRGLVERLLEKADLSLSEIDMYAIHPGGIKILEACEESLEISRESNNISYSILRDYGNMSSVTVMFVLRRYLETLSKADKGKKILSCAFGPGITMESMILEVV
jgi:alpha-pyrone synthase